MTTIVDAIAQDAKVRISIEHYLNVEVLFRTGERTIEDVRAARANMVAAIVDATLAQVAERIERDATYAQGIDIANYVRGLRGKE